MLQAYYIGEQYIAHLAVFWKIWLAFDRREKHISFMENQMCKKKKKKKISIIFVFSIEESRPKDCIWYSHAHIDT